MGLVHGASHLDLFKLFTQFAGAFPTMMVEAGSDTGAAAAAWHGGSAETPRRNRGRSNLRLKEPARAAGFFTVEDSELNAVR